MSHWESVLIVDDEKNSREGLGKFLDAQGYDTHLAADAKEALETLKKESPNVIISDIRMPEMDGITLLHKVKELDPKASVILLTAYGSVENAVQAMKAGAFHYLTKPVNLDELEFVIKKALSSQSLERENIELKKELIQEKFETETIISRSSNMKKVIELAMQVAKSESTVLLQGETGTGKELLAHLIHNHSSRKDRSFIAVHCASLTETLLASELFGHERGAFTGATERKVGRFERAHMGTLFLDEVGEIPESMQVKLLRVLQDGVFERVGGTKALKVDVRLICATNKNLAEEVKKGKFREDLFYRINVIMLEIPPLRDRKEDIRPLVDHYLSYFCKINNKKIDKITDDVYHALENYSWPGNIRELRNIIERMVVLATGIELKIENVPNDIRYFNAPVPSVMAISLSDDGAKPGDLQVMEKELIRKKLAELSGNKSRAAKELGISRRTLYRKIEEYQL
ncbi:MAG: sigma-54-dependent Fis family transcriptional regulator [Candidatus Omnitrophica bacterium]|nr:sigma-54-dependent Fis family transcriptional regulator [Candidatus Omnitrophota bacterium]